MTTIDAIYGIRRLCRIVNGMEVPPVLLNGNHKMIERWRLKQALGKTWLHRPDLLTELTLDEEQTELLAEFKLEDQQSE